MSEILGFGVNCYRQHEAGDIPTVASGRLIQAAKDPQEFKKFLDDNDNLVSHILSLNACRQPQYF
jgi:hypothetical protein